MKVKNKSKKLRFFKPLFMALILVFSVPIFAFADSPSSVTYNVHGATIVPSQSSYDSFATAAGHTYLVYRVTTDGKLYFYASDQPIQIKTSYQEIYTPGTLYMLSWASNASTVGTNYTVSYSYGENVGTQTYVVADTTAPSEITNLVETHNDTSVYFTWTNPTNTDFDHVNIYQGSTKIGTSTNGAFAVSSLTQSTTYSYKLTTVDKTGNESTGTIKAVTTDLTPTGTNPDSGSDTNNNNNNGGILNMFTNLTSAGILTEATSWANNFDDMLLVVVGVGIGFACVRFVKGLFF